jgi:NAD(P)-dependent dehydrogenase (short-subunit alcohol dehydrogenase family)
MTAHSAIVAGVGPLDGLGATLSRRFAKEGRHVFVAGRTPEKIEAVVAAIESDGGAATAVRTDVTDEAQVIALFEAAEKATPELDLVVYNAGNNMVSPLLEMEASFFEKAWRLACFGGFLVGREAARAMSPRGHGSILFTGATAALRGRPPFTAFSAGKAALRSLSQSMAREFGPQGLHVAHVVIDGVIDGEKVNTRMPQAREKLGVDGMLNLEAIADAYVTLHAQDRTAWTQELDLRPYKENF